MSAETRVTIRKLPTGVQGLDEILGGGLPEYSFNIIAGAPGCGKTTIAHQIAFANATPERPALYFTVLGEPALKMLRYQQQFSFFDSTRLNNAVRFINLSQVVLEQNLEAVLGEIVREVESFSPAIVVVDSFRTVVRSTAASNGEAEMQNFVQRLALHLTSWQATTFLIGEYTEMETRYNPVFTVSDGLLWVSQNVERNSVVRKLQVMKLRGQLSIPGLHTFRITGDGVQAFPRNLGLGGRQKVTKERVKLSLGNAELDSLVGGGIPAGDSLLVAGPSGSGKSVIATQFVHEGLRQGEPAIVVIFEERPDEYTGRAQSLGLDFEGPQQHGMLVILYLRPLDLSVDEAMRKILDAVATHSAKRVVIDSLAGFEMALAPGFRADFLESIYRMIGALTRNGVTVISTVEVAESFTEISLSHYSISFLSDDIIRLRYVEIDGKLRKILMVVKMRAGNHSKDIREFEITDTGLAVGKRLTGFHGLLTGIPRPLIESIGHDNPSHRSAD